MNIDHSPNAPEPEAESAAGPDVSRRSFLKATAAAGGGLLLGFGLPARLREGEAAAADSTFAPNAFIRIDREGGVTLMMHKVEMGQGTYTSMPMLLAEELEVDLAQVRLEHARPSDELYAEPLFGVQMTGGSTSVRGNWEPLRQAGATARTLLVAAAAQTWGVDSSSCHAERGEVIHGPTGRRLGYGALVDKAAALSLPRDVTLKEPKDFKLIGTPARRLDAPAKVDGSAQFGIDVKVPGMKIATVATCPVFGGKLASVDDSKARAIKGVHQVVRLDDAVAVVADHMWAARQGLAALDIRWDEGANAKLGTADIVQQLAAASQRSGVVAHQAGDASRSMASAAQKVEAVYEQPFLAHATMEPVNCTVHVRPDGCDVWVGTQVPTFARTAAAKVTGLPVEKVQVHNHLLGGGFGRRLEVDFIVRAVLIARQVASPVKVIWTREEDIQHDMYRPYYYDRIAAGLDEHGKPIAWTHRVTGPSIMARVTSELFPKTLKVIRATGVHQLLAMVRGLDTDAVEGAAEPPYAIPNIRVDYVRQEPPGIPTAFWRGVGPTRSVFVVESFIDELAAAVRQDPFEYRRALVDKSPRAKAVLELAADRAGWGQPLPARSGRGIALLHAFGETTIAQVAEVSVSKEGDVRVQRVVCAADCGTIVNPDTVKAQMESGIIFGITAALYGEITIKDGRVQQHNFDDYRMLRLNESPAIEVYLVNSTQAPGGVGEPGTSAVMPAVANAIFAATGRRIRKLPVKDQLRSV
ncbi:MAG TPA: xanthine dehydrogenase family protein molybdopterin-binding subunit [Burkholderiaceae bacterium]|nr:xanthine dehydrogenase family protein molybdopterin-binding subunit [Burkholderiaceae bacterium]